MGCTSCGMSCSGNSCSMCYGDPNHGDDGYYWAYIEQQQKEHYEMLEAQHYEELERQQAESLVTDAEGYLLNENGHRH